MSDMTEIKGLVEKVNEALVPLRTEVDALKAGQRDVVTEAKFTKMADQVTGALEKLQAIETQAKASEAKAAALEAAMQRGDLGGKGQGDTPEAKAKLDAFLRKDGEHRNIEIRAMQTDSQPDGGYLVLPELSATVVSRVFETSPLRLVANVEPTGAKSRTFLIDDDEGTAEWTGERTAATEDTPDLGEKEIVAHNLRAKMNATADVLADSYIDLAGWLTSKGADKLSRTENTAFFAGNGVARPRGLLTYSAWAVAGTYERDKIEQVISGAATTVTADGLINTQASLKEPYQASAVWLMKRMTFGAIIALKGADNFYFGPMMLKEGVPTMQVLGKRVIFCDDMQALGTGSNLAVAYGDFGRGYTILDRVGLQILRDPYTAHPYTVFHMTRRTGGDVTNFDSYKLMRLAAS
jgi:HK97 family phage major capsid protein